MGSSRRYRLFRVQDYGVSNTELIASLSGSDTSFVDWDMHCYDDYRYRVQAIGPDWESWSDVAYAAHITISLRRAATFAE